MNFLYFDTKNIKLCIDFDTNKKKTMKITLESYQTKHTTETENDDVTISEYFNHFRGLLVCAGFHIDTINSEILDMSEEIRVENGDI